MADDLKKRIADLVDGVIKLRLLATLPDEFLAYISHMEMTPNDANIAQLEQFYNELADHLQARAENYRPTVPASQPAQPESRLENFEISNRLIN